MKPFILILLLLISNKITSQIQDVDDLIKNIFSNLITNNGTSIQFEYNYEKSSHQIESPIKGHISLFSDNRFFVEFKRNEMNIIQLYDGSSLFTILVDDQEIQIDNIDGNSQFIINNILQEYQNNYQRTIIIDNKNYTTIKFTPKKNEYDNIYNDCIDLLELPVCLKLPRQCRIGIDSLNQNKLNDCISNSKQKNTNIDYIEINIDKKSQQIKSIKQIDQFNGHTTIEIINMKEADENLLKIDKPEYENFEIIDFRNEN